MELILKFNKKADIQIKRKAIYKFVLFNEIDLSITPME